MLAKNNLIIPTESKKLDPSMSRKGLTEEHMHRLLWILIVVPPDETQICFEDKYD